MKRILALVIILCSPNSFAGWDDMATAAATGYCLANHPYRTIHTGKFTPDGYEIVSKPGIAGAVRRNFIFDRATTIFDKGSKNSCKTACAEFGKLYGSSIRGVPLRQKIAGGKLVNDGIGDMASLTQNDYDFYLDKNVTAGIWSRANTWHESDVAQADYCCCQVVR